MPDKKQPPAVEEDRTDEEMDRRLRKLYDERGFDFRDNKKVGLRRRIRKRADGGF